MHSLSNISEMKRKSFNLTNYNTKYFFKSYRSTRTFVEYKTQSNTLDLSFFSVLTTVNQVQIFNLRTHVSDSS